MRRWFQTSEQEKQLKKLMLPTRVTVSSLIHCYSVFFRWSEIKGSEESNLPTILEEIKASFKLLINLKTTNKVTWEKTVIAKNVNIQNCRAQITCLSFCFEDSNHLSNVNSSSSVLWKNSFFFHMWNKWVTVIYRQNEPRSFTTHSVSGSERYFLMAV